MCVDTLQKMNSLPEQLLIFSLERQRSARIYQFLLLDFLQRQQNVLSLLPSSRVYLAKVDGDVDVVELNVAQILVQISLSVEDDPQENKSQDSFQHDQQFVQDRPFGVDQMKNSLGGVVTVADVDQLFDFSNFVLEADIFEVFRKLSARLFQVDVTITETWVYVFGGASTTTKRQSK
jgi:hypothetical protein